MGADIYLHIQIMKLYLIYALLLIIASPVKVFLFGSVLLNDSSLAYQKLIQVVGKPVRQNCSQDWNSTDCPKVAVITSACPDSACGQSEYNIGDGDYEAATGPFFEFLGMAPKHIKVHVDNYQTATDPLTQIGVKHKQYLGVADIIYFNGGDQSRHARCWFNDNGTDNTLLALIRRRTLNNEVVIIGVSAGTAIQSVTTYGSGSSHGILYFSNLVGLAPNTVASGIGLDDVRNGTGCLQQSENGAKMQGFGFVDTFQIDTHFDRRGRLGRLVPALSELGVPIGVGIDEKATFYYENGIGTVYGKNGVFIADISTALKMPTTYFTMKGVKVHYLTAGDQFHFKTKTLKTNKAYITPSQSGFSDSSSILTAYECTRSITRLVDQNGIFNQGMTTIPQGEDYPPTTPTFIFTFYKRQCTHGYRSGDQITAENVLLDIQVVVKQ